jgi:hypothetical protein
MTDFLSLPNELLLAIIENLLPPEEGIPITGFNAAWTPASSVERRHSFYHLDECAATWFDGTEHSLDGSTTNIRDTPYSRYSTLWALRQ